MAAVEDEHFFVVKGRRWRRTDPAIPEALRQELVDELMAARRAIGGGDRSPPARARVQDAEVALGERGEPWWAAPTPEGRRTRAAAAARALGRRRDGSTVDPEDVARVVAGDGWAAVVDEVRAAVRAIPSAGVERA